MTRLVESKKRLESAMRDLEAAVENRLMKNGVDEETLQSLHQEQANNAALKKAADTVRVRLDNTIERLETLLEN